MASDDTSAELAHECRYEIGECSAFSARDLLEDPKLSTFVVPYHARTTTNVPCKY